MSNGTFLLMICGQIEYVETFTSAGTTWHCKYEFVSGTDWKIVGGLQSGVSQIVNVSSNDNKVILNLPIEVVYKSTNPHGWPQIVLSVYKGTNLQGYGRAYAPLQAGVHKLKVSTSAPLPSSLLGKVATLFGYQPELLQPAMLATTAGNNLIQMVSSGEASMALNVTFHGLQGLEYDMGKSFQN
ncbi:hypothetical protein PPYR_13152 [Photinus pyralis]|uniref:B9 domain-containing protein 1 n=2 Tax=Photinus pyralis TaxID=7054 RepID=A0A5N4A896_PHOPY|nr:B9 domain-containing protein 1-like [Photinus pyralis]KAB0793532.1 hypothetical protein PPYR_13152 [Photinus pyralis]